MAMSKDIRVILIKISDRLHNMRTMEYQTPEKQKQKSFRDHGDLCPHCPPAGNAEDEVGAGGSEPEIYLDPISYREIVEALNEKAAQYDGFMSSIHDQITRRLREAHIDGYVYGRMKHPYPSTARCIPRTSLWTMYTTSSPSGSLWTRCPTATMCWASSTTCISPFWAASSDYIGTPQAQYVPEPPHHREGQNGIPLRGADPHP